jgi:hypothetical protein
MTWEFYEVWAEDDDGHEELIETTKSRTEALTLAKKSLDENDYASTVVYQEKEDGDLVTIERFYAD